MRLIDADAFFEDFPEVRDYEFVSQEYEVDAVPVVRCEECIHHDVYGRTTKYYGCTFYDIAVDADHFCKKGERRADG